MGLDRAVLVGGPAKIYTGVVGIWTPDTLKLRLDPNTNELAPSLFGRIGEAENDRVLSVSSFTPFGLWQNLTTLIPAYYTSPTIGARLMGNADVAWKIWSNDGALYTIKNGAVTSPPQLKLCADRPVFGSMSISGCVANSSNPSTANSYYTIAAAQADPGGAFATTHYRQQQYTGVWGAIAGFGAIQAQDGWTIDLQPRLEPIKVQGYTRDFKLASMMITAKATPVGPTAAQIYAAIEDMTAGGRLGEKGLGDLVITGEDGVASVTLTNMALKNRGFAFGSKELRNDELTWVNVVKFTAGVPGALISFTTGE